MAKRISIGFAVICILVAYIFIAYGVANVKGVTYAGRFVTVGFFIFAPNFVYLAWIYDHRKKK